MQINHSPSRISDHYFLLSLQQLSWGLLRTNNVSSQAFAKSFESKKFTAAEKIWQKSHCVYPYKIIQISSLGQQQKNSMEHNQKNPSRQYYYSAKLLSNKLPNHYSNAYKKYWNNSETIYMFLECNFADLRHYFVHWVN